MHVHTREASKYGSGLPPWVPPSDTRTPNIECVCVWRKYEKTVVSIEADSQFLAHFHVAHGFSPFAMCRALDHPDAPELSEGG